MRKVIKLICSISIFCFSCETVINKNDTKDSAKLANDKKESILRYHDSILVRMLCRSERYEALIKNLNHPEMQETTSNYDPGFIYKKYNNKFRFSMFKVDSIYRGKLARPDFKNSTVNPHWFPVYRDECNNRKVNFAGHFTIVEMDCGCMCNWISVVDRISGKIYDNSPFDTLDGHYGARFKANSRMIIVNSGLLDDADMWGHKGYYHVDWHIRPSTYEWRDSVFVKID